MPPVLQVALGGAVGASARYAVGVAVKRALGQGMAQAALATLAVNVAGCLAMGLLAASLLPRHAHLAPLLMTGLLGGFTTFSAFSLDAAGLWGTGQPGVSVLYVAASVVLSMLAVLAGLALGRAA